MTLGTSFDTHGPMGAWLVTPDEVGDPHALRIRTTVSGGVLQDGTTADMLFDIAMLSTVCTLEPATLIAAGTPAGVGLVRNPRRLLRDGDVVRVGIDGIGAIENRSVTEHAGTGAW
jgi:2-keto-4-pentenoate hydratase/2-oxohepta-3-ene-1,7-dioic acid hydratase in catechol pathway